MQAVKTWFGVMVVFGLTMVSSTALAVPSYVPLQGYLTDDLGVPITDTKSITFALYPDDLATTPLHTETDDYVAVLEGYFTTYLTAAPLSVFRDNAEIYVGITVNSGAGLLDGVEMEPRLPMATTPYAAFADNAAYYPGGGSLTAIDTQAAIDQLLQRIEELEAKTAHMHTITVDGYPATVFQGTNVHIRNGTGSTTSTNGLGNLTVGYNQPLGSGNDRSGSHNLIAGDYQNYLAGAYGGIVVGKQNTISGPHAAILGGHLNEASGEFASVLGGYGNVATGDYCSILGGYQNNASEWVATAMGGYYNSAEDSYSTVSGGANNTTTGYASSVSGGYGNIAGYNHSSVSGGYYNVASGYASSVSGGSQNTASNSHSSVSGGSFNTAMGSLSSVSGGHGRSVTGTHDWSAGSLFEDQ